MVPVRAAYKAAGKYYHSMREPVALKYLAGRIEKHLRAPSLARHASQPDPPVSMVAGASWRMATNPRKLPSKGASRTAHIQDGKGAFGRNVMGI